MAAAKLLRLLRLLPVICICGTGVFKLPVRQHVARGGLSDSVFCARRSHAGIGNCKPALARQHLPFAVGMVPYLFRIRHRETAQRRSAMAKLYSDGRVLSERPAADVDRMVHRTFAALVSRGDGGRDIRDGACCGLDAVSSRRRARFVCFCIVTPWEICVIFTANYTFLNYLVLALGFLLLDDRSLRRLFPQRFRATLPATPKPETTRRSPNPLSIVDVSSAEIEEIPPTVLSPAAQFKMVGLVLSATMLTWIAYATTAELIQMPMPDLPLPSPPGDKCL